MNVPTDSAPFISDPNAQVAWLQSQGLIIPEPGKAVFYLRAMGWYRFNGYLTPFIGVLGSERVTFDSVLRLYRFDRRLRLHMLNALERIEVMFKNLVLCHLVDTHGPRWIGDIDEESGEWVVNTAWVNPKHRNNPRGEKHIRKMETELEELAETLRDRAVDRKIAALRAQRIEVNRDNIPRNEFDSHEITEIMSFGLASLFFEALPRKAQVKIARDNYWPIYHDTLMHWFQCLNAVRNIAAHHGRLWNLDFRSCKVFPERIQETLVLGPDHPSLRTQLYGRCIMIFVLLGRAARDTRWHETLDTIIRKEGEQDVIDIYDRMGFPKNWLSAPVWDSTKWNGHLPSKAIRQEG